MLDYETDVKRHVIELLAGDLFGKGRVESAIFHTFQHVYEKGIAEGEQRIKELETQVEMMRSILYAAKGDYCHPNFTDRGSMCSQITQVLKETQWKKH